MTAVGAFAIFFGLLIGGWLALRCRTSMYVWLFLLHLGAAFFYWHFTLERIADALGYYRYPASGDSIVGTMFIRHIVQWLKEDLGASYLDCYMVFHLPGYLGISLLLHVLTQTILAGGNASSLTRFLVAASVLVPSLHVWTAAVGKDSIMFFGIMSFVWGMADAKRRFWMMILGLGVSFMVRPHVALTLVAAFAVTVSLSDNMTIGRRLMVVTTLSALVAVALPFVYEYVGLNAKGTDGIGEYIEQRQAANMEGGSSVNISEYPLPLQFFTYMYGPLFFDADSALSLVVSCEHLVYLVATLVLGASGIRYVLSSESTQFIRFNFVFWFVCTLIFATTISNLGLAVRQKTGMLPSFFIFILATQRRRFPGQDKVAVPDASTRVFRGGSLLAERPAR